MRPERRRSSAPWLLLGLAVLPPILVIGWTAIQWRQHEIADAESMALLLARHFASEYEREIGSARATLLRLARAAHSLDGDAELGALLATTLREQSQYESVGAFTPPDRFLSITRASGPANRGSLPVLHRALEMGQFTIGDLEFDPTARQMKVTFAQPTTEFSDTGGRVLFAVMDFAWLHQSAQAETLLPAGTALTVVNAAGTIAARWPEPGKWVGQSMPQEPTIRAVLAAGGEGTVEAIGADGVPQVVAFTPVRSRDGTTKLYVSVATSRAEALATTDRLLAQDLGMFGLVVALGLVAGGIAIKRHEALTAQARRFGAILDEACDGVSLFDRDGRFVYVSLGAARLFGRDETSLLGRPLMSLVHEEHQADVAARLAEASSRPRRSVVVTFRVGSREAAGVCLECELRNLSDDSDVGAVLATYHDVTDTVWAPTTHWHAREALSRVIEQTADSVLITDPEGLIEYVNPAFEATTGFTRTEVIGQTPRILRSGIQTQRFYQNLWTTILSGRTFRSTMTNRRKDGGLYEEDLTITPIRDTSGAITHFVSTARDITHQTRAQEALRRVTAQLEREAARIAGVLHDEAGQFLMLAHIALADVARDVQPLVRERLQEVRQHLDQIEERLRHVAHEIHPRIVEDLGLCEAVGFYVDGFSRRTGIAVTVPSTLDRRFVLSIETLLYRVVQEGLTNVGRHARATTAIVTLSADGDTVSCSIRDNGVGLDERALPPRGGGLGLQLMKDRLAAVGGTLTITSTPGHGTELRASVPVED